MLPTLLDEIKRIFSQIFYQSVICSTIFQHKNSTPNFWVVYQTHTVFSKIHEILRSFQGNIQTKHHNQNNKKQIMEPGMRLELMTHALRMRCSTNWATTATKSQTMEPTIRLELMTVRLQGECSTNWAKSATKNYFRLRENFWLNFSTRPAVSTNRLSPVYAGCESDVTSQ